MRTRAEKVTGSPVEDRAKLIDGDDGFCFQNSYLSDFTEFKAEKKLQEIRRAKGNLFEIRLTQMSLRKEERKREREREEEKMFQSKIR